ncbi:MAG: TonB family protein [Acidobacteriota bacterium]
MSTGSKLSSAALLLLSFGLVASAQISRTVPAPRMMQGDLPSGADSDAANDWARRLHKADEHLRAGEWNKPRRDTDRMIYEMLFGIKADAGAAATLGLTLTFRALAEAGGGDVEAGRWNWLAAQALQPDLNEVSLDPYGAAGKALDPFRLGGDRSLSAFAARSLGVEPGPPKADQEAKKLSGAEPRYPKALKATCEKGTARIAVTVDSTGRPVHPRWLDASGGPVMALALFEAVRDWRWQPARRGDQAVPMEVKIEHLFDPGRCRPRAGKT